MDDKRFKTSLPFILTKKAVNLSIFAIYLIVLSNVKK